MERDVRERLKALVADLEQRALAPLGFRELCRLCFTAVAEGLGVEFAAVCELSPDGRHLMLRSGAGWPEALLGQATESVAAGSQAQFILSARSPVILRDLRLETRFRPSRLLREQGILSGIGVAIQGHDQPFGVLGAYTTRIRRFTAEEAAFLEAVANIFALAVERSRADRALRWEERHATGGEGAPGPAAARQHAAFRGLLEAAPDAIVISNSDGRIVFVNRQAELLFGYGPDELIGERIERLVPEEYRSAHAGHRAGFYQERRTRPMGSGLSLEACRHDGSRFAAEISLSPLEVDGELLVTAVIRDISECRKAEEKFRGLLEAAPDAIVIADRQGNISLVNTRTEQLFGYDRQELLGQPVEVLLPDHLREGHRRFRRRYYGELRTRPMGGDLDLWGRRRDGVVFPVEISLSPLETDDELLVIAVIRDITERKAAEERVRQLNIDLHRRVAELSATNEELEAFSLSASHDLLSPLRAMQIIARSALAGGGEVPEQAVKALEGILSTAQDMAGVVEGLLSMARLTARELNYELVDLSDIARMVTANLRAAAPEREVEVVIAENVYAQGDPWLLRVVLENLIGNAWKYTGKTERPRIEFGVQKGEDDRPVFFVRDNGAGFDMNQAYRLFEPFSRLHSRTEFEGNGIGLATVKRIIRRHGGQIWAEAAAGEGATFYFTL